MRHACLRAGVVIGGVLALLATAGVSCVGPAQWEQEIERRCRNISDNNIMWHGTDIGLLPSLEGKNENWILETEENAEPYLLQALDDPGKWIAAHVLLTERWARRHPGWSYPTREYTAQYNGLYVMLYADGGVEIDESQRPAIRQYWIEQLGATKAHPGS